MHERLRVALAIIVSLIASPTIALAEDGFIGGLQDFAGVREVEEVQPEKEYNDSYEPTDVDLYAKSESVRALPENPTTSDYINNTVDNLNSVPVGIRKITILGYLQYALGHYNDLGIMSRVLIPAVCMVFVWWGVRKAIRMVMSAFRRGKANV